METFKMQIIESIDDFIEMKDLWEMLHARSVFPTVFNSWEWIYSCIIGFAYEKICIVAVWDLNDSSVPRLIIPLFIYKKGMIKYANIIGTEMSDYCNFLIDKDIEPINIFYDTIKKAANIYNFAKVYINQIPDKYYKDSILTSRLLYNGLLLLTSKGTSTYYAQLPEADCLKTISKKTIKNVQRNLRKLEGQNAKIVCLKSSPCNLLDAFYNYHKVKWGNDSLFVRKEYRNFLYKICELMSSINQLIFFSVFKDENPVSFSISFIDCTRFYGYLTVYDTRHSSLSPGHLLIYSEYLYCSKSGLKYFDLLRGDESYKKKWVPNECRTSCINIYRINTVGCLLFLYDIIIYFLKKLKRLIKRFLQARTCSG